MKLSAILLTIALFVSASAANAATPSQQAQPSGTQQAAEDAAKDVMPGGDAAAAKPAGKIMPAAKDAKDMKDAPKGNQMAPESK